MNLENKKVVVVGLGRSGIASALYLRKNGARVLTSDSKSEQDLAEALKSLEGFDIEFSLGKNDPAIFKSADLVVLSPGVPIDLPGLDFARANGIKVVGDLEVASWYIDKPIAAITGTNGKTTTTALTGHLLKNSEVNVLVGGNIGDPILGLMDGVESCDVVVVEMSSFQIETSPTLSPKVATILNVTPDHLDRHKTFEEYVACKAKLFEKIADDGTGIYNACDDRVAQSVLACRCNLFPFDATGNVLSRESERGGRAWFDGSSLCILKRDGDLNRYSLDDVGLKGVHNRENMLAALSICEILGAEQSLLQGALNSFKGLPHRMQHVLDVNGISFFNDSKGTNVGATQRALEQFAEPVILIAGGLAKGADITALKKIISERVKHLVLIGESTSVMAAAFDGCSPITKAVSMEEAVYRAYEFAEPGDVVLLSPACASFDMFDNYVHRGNVFIETAKELSKKVVGAVR